MNDPLILIHHIYGRDEARRHSLIRGALRYVLASARKCVGVIYLFFSPQEIRWECVGDKFSDGERQGRVIMCHVVDGFFFFGRVGLLRSR